MIPYWRQFRFGAAAGLALVMVALCGPTSGAASGRAEPAQLTTSVFADVPFPGHPEGVVVADDGTVYVGTHQDATGGPGGPSRVFAYDQDGRLKREYVIEGQEETGQGIVGMAIDGHGLLYILDRHPARVITLNPETGEQRDYAYFRDVPPCEAGQSPVGCSATTADAPAFADDLVFAPDGSLYATDTNQGLIWRIPAGGGRPEVWFTHPDLEGLFGPNGIRFLDSHMLMFAVSLPGVTDPAEMSSGAGRLYTLPIRADGSAGDLDLFWEGRPGEAPDGFAIGRSGNVYVALALGNALLVLSPDGHELARTLGTEADNAQQAVPYDTPASVAFAGTRVLISNQAYFGGPPEHQVILEVPVGERGRPLFRPCV